MSYLYTEIIDNDFYLYISQQDIIEFFKERFNEKLIIDALNYPLDLVSKKSKKKAKTALNKKLKKSLKNKNKNNDIHSAYIWIYDEIKKLCYKAVQNKLNIHIMYVLNKEKLPSTYSIFHLLWQIIGYNCTVHLIDNDNVADIHLDEILKSVNGNKVSNLKFVIKTNKKLNHVTSKYDFGGNVSIVESNINSSSFHNTKRGSNFISYTDKKTLKMASAMYSI